MKIKIEKSLIEFLLKRPIQERRDYKQKKSDLDQNLLSMDKANLTLMRLHIQSISQRFPDVEDFLHQYEKFIEDLLQDMKNSPPALPVDFFLTEKKKIALLEKILENFTKLYVAKNLGVFQKIRTYKKVNLETIALKWKRLRRKTDLKLIVSSARISFVASKYWNVLSLFNLIKAGKISRRFKSLSNSLEKVRERLRKEEINYFYLKIRLIKRFFSKVRSPVEGMIRIKIKSILNQGFFKMKAPILYKENLKRLFGSISKSLYNFRALKNLSKKTEVLVIDEENTPRKSIKIAKKIINFEENWKKWARRLAIKDLKNLHKMNIYFGKVYNKLALTILKKIGKEYALKRKIKSLISLLVKHMRKVFKDIISASQFKKFFEKKVFLRFSKVFETKELIDLRFTQKGFNTYKNWVIKAKKLERIVGLLNKYEFLRQKLKQNLIESVKKLGVDRKKCFKFVSLIEAKVLKFKNELKNILKKVKKLKGLKNMIDAEIKRSISNRFIRIYRKSLLKKLELRKKLKIFTHCLLKISKKQDSVKLLNQTLMNRMNNFFRFAWEKLRKIEKDYKCPFSAKVTLHNLSSYNSQSTSKAFASLNSLPKNVAVEQNQIVLRILSVISSSITNQQNNFKDIDKEIQTLQSQCSDSVNIVKIVKNEIEKNEKNISEETVSKKEKSSNRKILENLSQNFLRLEESLKRKTSEFFYESQKLNKIDSEISQFKSTLYQKKLEVVHLENELSVIEYDLKKKDVEKEDLEYKNLPSNRKANLSPVSGICNKSFYRTSPRKNQDFIKSMLNSQDISTDVFTSINKKEKRTEKKIENKVPVELVKQLSFDEKSQDSTKKLMAVVFFLLVAVGITLYF